MKQAECIDMLKKASWSAIMVSPDPLVSYSTKFFSNEGSGNIQEDPDDPDPGGEADIQMEYSSD